MDQPEIKSAPGAAGRAPRDQPLVLIPVMAEDVAREWRRKVLISVSVGLVLLVAGGIGYRRTARPNSSANSSIWIPRPEKARPEVPIPSGLQANPKATLRH
jgi:hypothetical protein